MKSFTEQMTQIDLLALSKALNGAELARGRPPRTITRTFLSSATTLIVVAGVSVA